MTSTDVVRVGMNKKTISFIIMLHSQLLCVFFVSSMGIIFVNMEYISFLSIKNRYPFRSFRQSG